MSTLRQNLFGTSGGLAKKHVVAAPTAAPSSKSSSINASERQTHIEVCARVRPLQISMQSSTSYFNNNNNDKDGSNLRKPPVPPGGRGSSKIGGGIPPPGSTQKSQQQQQQPGPEENLFYAWDVVDDDTAAQSPKTEIVQGRTHQYTLDKVYGPSNTTRDLYNQSVKGLVHSAMEGFHSAVLAYGQTSTGKTFTMTGTPSSPGIVPLAVHQCFQCLEKNREYLIRVSYLEVYKEQIRDLLAEGANQIRLFDHREQGLIIKGLREEVVTCPKQIFEILAQGEKRRKIGATNMNQHSSRSHVMVRMWIESRAIDNNNSPMSRKSSSGSLSSNGKRGTPVRVSSLSLVDLAGSESVRLHGANEARRQEGHYINKSLMALGKVVYALSEQGKQKASGKVGGVPLHIPYRDSKLTRLLQPSLSGNAQMVLICCISPLATHIEESHNTFKFATRAKKVPQKATIQESVDEKTLLQTYREEIEALKQQLREARTQQVALVQEHQAHQVEAVLDDAVEEEEMDDEVQELKLAIRNMEHLILKSKAASPPAVPGATTSMSQDDLLDAIIDSDNDDDDEDDEAALLSLMTETQKSSGAPKSPNPTAHSPPRTPRDVKDTSGDMHKELNRIQGLLGSVLKKRTRGVKSPATAGSPRGVHALSSSNGEGNTKNAAEVNMLRAQLEEQEATTSLRQADSSFLQKQLDEKDSLLAEVSKILEQVEQRQVDLEKENDMLKAELTLLKSTQPPSSPITPVTGGRLDV